MIIITVRIANQIFFKSGKISQSMVLIYIMHFTNLLASAVFMSRIMLNVSQMGLTPPSCTLILKISIHYVLNFCWLLRKPLSQRHFLEGGTAVS